MIEKAREKRNLRGLPLKEKNMQNLSNFKKSGFTLLELLVVVGILAALVALALPFYQDYVNQSKLTAAEADLKTFSKALSMYDQMEPAPFTDTDFLDLIGKYLQDFRTDAAQTMPRDPWTNAYQVNAVTGAVWSMGPNGTDESVNARVSGGDDIMVTWKPDFFVNGARRINDRLLEVSFSRKVNEASLAANAVSVTTAAITSNSVQRVSDTVFRFGFASDLDPNDTVTVSAATALDTRTLAAAGNQPNGDPANQSAY